MMMPNAMIGTNSINTCRVDFLKSNTEMAPVHRPIIKLPQYMEMNGAACEDWYPPKSGCFNNSLRLLTIVTSTPTYTKMPSMPSTNCGYCMAPHPAGFRLALMLDSSSDITTTANAPSSHF